MADSKEDLDTLRKEEEPSDAAIFEALIRESKEFDKVRH